MFEYAFEDRPVWISTIDYLSQITLIRKRSTSFFFLTLPPPIDAFQQHAYPPPLPDPSYSYLTDSNTLT